MANDVAAVIPAAGSGSRLRKSTPKALVRLAGVPLIIHTVKQLLRCGQFSYIAISINPALHDQFKSLMTRYGLKEVKLVTGGRSRAESVRNAVMQLPATTRWVLIHDAARPFVTSADVAGLLRAGRKTGAAILTAPVSATVKRVSRRGSVVLTERREDLRLALTPQLFERKRLLERYAALGDQALNATDEAALFDGSDTPVVTVEGDEGNIKITTPADLDYAAFRLKRRL